jgi:hypothetical protein
MKYTLNGKCILLKKKIINIWKWDPLRKGSMYKLEIDKQVPDMIVIVEKYERDSKCFSMEQEKFRGSKNIVLDSTVLLIDTNTFFSVIVWCF